MSRESKVEIPDAASDRGLYRQSAPILIPTGQASISSAESVSPAVPLSTPHNFGFLARSESSISNSSATRDLRFSLVSPRLRAPFIDGLRFQSVSREGHCLFNAVALYINKDIDQLRAELVDCLMQQLADPDKAVELTALIQASCPDKTIEHYIQDLRDRIEWSDQLEIEMLSRFLQQPIVIIERGGNIQPSQYLSRYENRDPVFVYYNGQDHYDAFLLEEGSSPQEILHSLLEGPAGVGIERPNLPVLFPDIVRADAKFVPMKLAHHRSSKDDYLVHYSHYSTVGYEYLLASGKAVLEGEISPSGGESASAFVHMPDTAAIASATAVKSADEVSDALVAGVPHYSPLKSKYDEMNDYYAAAATRRKHAEAGGVMRAESAVDTLAQSDQHAHVVVVTEGAGNTAVKASAGSASVSDVDDFKLNFTVDEIERHEDKTQAKCKGFLSATQKQQLTHLAVVRGNADLLKLLLGDSSDLPIYDNLMLYSSEPLRGIKRKAYLPYVLSQNLYFVELIQHRRLYGHLPSGLTEDRAPTDLLVREIWLENIRLEIAIAWIDLVDDLILPVADIGFFKSVDELYADISSKLEGRDVSHISELSLQTNPHTQHLGGLRMRMRALFKDTAIAQGYFGKAIAEANRPGEKDDAAKAAEKAAIAAEEAIALNYINQVLENFEELFIKPIAKMTSLAQVIDYLKQTVKRRTEWNHHSKELRDLRLLVGSLSTDPSVKAMIFSTLSDTGLVPPITGDSRRLPDLSWWILQLLAEPVSIMAQDQYGNNLAQQAFLLDDMSIIRYIMERVNETIASCSLPIPSVSNCHPNLLNVEARKAQFARGVLSYSFDRAVFDSPNIFNQTVIDIRWRYMLIVTIYDAFRDKGVSEYSLSASKETARDKEIRRANQQFFDNLMRVGGQIEEIVKLLNFASEELNRYKDEDLPAKADPSLWQRFVNGFLDAFRFAGPTSKQIASHRILYVARLLALLAPKEKSDYVIRRERGVEALLESFSTDLKSVRKLSDATGNAVIIELFKFAAKVLEEFEEAQSARGATARGKLAALCIKMKEAHDRLLPRIRQTLNDLKGLAVAAVPSDSDNLVIAHPDDVAVSALAVRELAARRQQVESEAIERARKEREDMLRRAQEAEQNANRYREAMAEMMRQNPALLAGLRALDPTLAAELTASAEPAVASAERLVSPARVRSSLMSPPSLNAGAAVMPVASEAVTLELPPSQSAAALEKAGATTDASTEGVDPAAVVLGMK